MSSSSRNWLTLPHLAIALALGNAVGCSAPAPTEPGENVGNTSEGLITGAINISDNLLGLRHNSDAESQTVAVAMGSAIAVAYNSFFVPVADTRCPRLSQIAMSYLTGPTWQAIHIPVGPTISSSVAALRFTPSIAYVDAGSNYTVYVSNVAYSTSEWPGYNGNHDPAVAGNDCIPYNHQPDNRGYTDLHGDKLCVTQLNLPKSGAAATITAQNCFGEPGANYFDTALTAVAGQTGAYLVSWNQATHGASFFTTAGVQLSSPFPNKTIQGAPIFAKNTQAQLVAPDINGAFWWTRLNPAGSNPTLWTWSAPVPLSSSTFPYHWGDLSLPDGIATLNQYSAVMMNGFMGPGAMYLFYRSGTSVVGFARGEISSAPGNVFISRPGFNAFTPAVEIATIPNEFGIAPGAHPMLSYWDNSGPGGNLVLNHTWPGQPVFAYGDGQGQVPCPRIGAGYWGYRDDMVVQNNYTNSPTVWRFFTDSTHGTCDFSADEAAHIQYAFFGQIALPSSTPQHVSAYTVPVFPATCGILHKGDSLIAGTSHDAVTSCDGRFFLVMQGDGNLVLYQNGVGALWATGTNGRADNPTMAVLQFDGSLVVQSATSQAWSSSSPGGDHLLVQGDGNVVIYAGPGTFDSPLWASNTCCR